METCWYSEKKVFTLTRDSVLGYLKKKIVNRKGILQNSNGNSFLYTFTGHMIGLLVRTGSLGHGVAGATRCHIAFHNSSKVERVILKFLLL